MAFLTAEPVLDCANHVGESPIWDAQSRQVLWVDVPEGKLFALDPSSGALRQWQRPTAIGAIALHANGGLIAGCAEGFYRLTFDSDGLNETEIAPVLRGRNDMRLNDGVCDRQGRFWSGSMRLTPDPADPAGVLYRLDQDRATPMLEGLVVQNGLAWSPDGRVMYLSDSHRSRAQIWAFDYDGDTGTPTNRRLFADLAGTGGRPDGAAMDSDGGYWIAASDAGKVMRFTPDGRIDAEVLVPTSNPTKLCFGGPDHKTMFITSLRPAQPDALAGSLFAVETQWQGMSETPYRPAT